MDNSESDSSEVILGLYSDVRNVDSSLIQFDALIFPSGPAGGNPYNLRTFAIMNQAENYTVAVDFINFYSNFGYNDELNERMETLSIYEDMRDTDLEFYPYKVKPEKLIPYHSITRRVINKL